MLQTTKQRAMRATIGIKSAKNSEFFDKMQNCSYKIMAINPKNGAKIMTFAYDYSKSSVCTGYLALWFDAGKAAIKDVEALDSYRHGDRLFGATFGQGKAGGYGYCKMSAAFQAALNAANIEIFGDIYGSDTEKLRKKEPVRIAGVGERAVEQAMLAICHAVGFNKVILIQA